MELIRKTGIKEYRGKREMHGLFKCHNCGLEVERRLCDGGKLKTCGCRHLKAEKKDWWTPLHKVWSAIKQRCKNKNCRSYKTYGAKGITYCDEWESFPKFKKWALENGYREDLQIDRIDNNGNYEPSNCRFVTCTENNRNRPSTKLNMKKAELIRFIYKSGTHTQKELAQRFNVSPSVISEIIRNLIWKNLKPLNPE